MVTFLFNPFIIKRTSTGLIENYTRASTASYEEFSWILKNVSQTNFKKMEPSTSIKMNLKLHPDDLSVQTKNFEEMRLSSLWKIVSLKKQFNEDTLSSRSAFQANLYQLWFQRKLAQPFGLLLMVVLAAPMGLFMARQYNALLVGFGFVSAGFLYFITERILLSLGETVILPPFLAAWSPFLIFLTMSLWFMLHKQE